MHKMKLQHQFKNGSPLLMLQEATWTSTTHMWHSLSRWSFCTGTQSMELSDQCMNVSF